MSASIAAGLDQAGWLSAMLALFVLALPVPSAEAFELTWAAKLQIPSNEVLPGYLDGTVRPPPKYWVGPAYGGLLDYEMHYHVDLPGWIPDVATWEEIFDLALNSWREATGFRLTWQSARLDASADCGAGVDQYAGTGINPVMFIHGCPWHEEGAYGGSAGIDVLGGAWRGDGGDIYESNINIFDFSRGTKEYRIEADSSLLVHELGHTLGLGHPKNFSSVLAGGGIWIPAEKKHRIGHDDICGIAASIGDFERCSSYLGGASSEPFGAATDAHFFGYASGDGGYSPQTAFARREEIDIFTTIMPRPDHRIGSIAVHVLAVRGNGAIETLAGDASARPGIGKWRVWAAPGVNAPIDDGLPISFAGDFFGAAEDFVLVGANENRADNAPRSWLPEIARNRADPVTPEKLGWEKETVYIYIAYTPEHTPEVFYFSPNPITVHVY